MVAAPKIPSMPPRTEIDACVNACWRAVTIAPRCPRIGKAGLGDSPRRNAVVEFTTPELVSPLLD